jgi:hypothetical protein
MPIPGSRVIPARWSEHHRPVASASMRGTCSISRPDTDTADDVYDPATLQYTSGAGTSIYVGPCRVQALSTAEARQTFGEQDVTTRRYMVAIEWDAAEVAVNDVVTVDTADDPDLPGRKLRVLDVATGTEQWERDLVCQDWQG